MHEALAGELGAGPPGSLDHHLRADVRLERSEGELLLAGEFLHRGAIFGNDRDRALRERRHDGGDHHAGAVLAQLLGERAGTRERVARHLGAEAFLLRKLDEIRGVLEQGSQDDDVGLALPHFLDACLDIRLHAILERRLRHRLVVALLQRAVHGSEVLAADHVVVIDDREALHAEWREVLDDLLQLVGVARAHVVHVLVEHPHRVRAGERVHERHLVLVDERQRRTGQRRTRVAEQSENGLRTFDQLLGVLAGALDVVTVIDRRQLELAAVHATRVVYFLEIGERAVANVLAELGVRAGERGGLADADGGRRDSLAESRSGEDGANREGRQSIPQSIFHGRFLLIVRTEARIMPVAGTRSLVLHHSLPSLHFAVFCSAANQQPSRSASSVKLATATSTHAGSATRSVFCPGPCSVGRGTKAVASPWALAALRSPLCAATIMTSAGARPRCRQAARYASGIGL